MSGSGVKTAIVTGSTSGIGRAIAERLAAEGYGVVLNSVRSVEAGDRLAKALPEAVYVRGSVTEPGMPRQLIDAALERWGRLDVVVNNAGTTRIVPLAAIDQVTESDWEEILQTNVVAPWRVVQAAVPVLRASGGGVVINVSSIAGMRPGGSSIPYAVSKAALNHLTQLLASVLGPEIRVNAVAPGLTDTPWGESLGDIRARVIDQAPLHRTARPEDIAEACWSLIACTYVTGAVLPVDGGMQLR
jgi:ketoreductase RED2